MTEERSAAGQAEPVPEVQYYPSGAVRYTGYLLDGESDGEWEWFRTDGTIMRSGRFDRGRQVGTWRTFERSGRLVKATEFPPRG